MTEQNQLATIGTAGPITVYDRVEDPIRWVEKIGEVLYRSGAGGAKTMADGQLLALAMLCERKSVFDINRSFHLMDGKLTMRADAMLAAFRSRGGTFEWTEDGENGIAATVALTMNGKTLTSRFTFEQAQKAGYVKGGGGWTKDPGAMLRARAVSRGVRMLCPEIVAGYLTPEEAGDEQPTSQATTLTVQVNADDIAKQRTATEQRRRELEATATTPATVVAPPPIDVPFDILPTEQKSEPLAESLEKDLIIAEIEQLAVSVGSSLAAVVTRVQSKQHGVTSLDLLPLVELITLRDSVRTAVEKKLSQSQPS